jgi:hypothetical protein
MIMRKNLYIIILFIYILSLFLIITNAVGSSEGGQSSGGACCSCCEDSDKDKDGDKGVEQETEEIITKEPEPTIHDCTNRSATTTSNFAVNLTASPSESLYSYQWNLQIYSCAGSATYDLKVYQETSGSPPTSGPSATLKSGELSENTSVEVGGFEEFGYEYKLACLLINAPDNPETSCISIPKVTTKSNQSNQSQQPEVKCKINSLSTCGSVDPSSVDVSSEDREVSITVSYSGAGSIADCKDKTFVYTLRNSERQIASGTGKFDDIGACSGAGHCEALTIRRGTAAGRYDLVITSNEDSNLYCTNSNVLTIT